MIKKIHETLVTKAMYGGSNRIDCAISDAELTSYWMRAVEKTLSLPRRVTDEDVIIDDNRASFLRHDASDIVAYVVASHFKTLGFDRCVTVTQVTIDVGIISSPAETSKKRLWIWRATADYSKRFAHQTIVVVP